MFLNITLMTGCVSKYNSRIACVSKYNPRIGYVSKYNSYDWLCFLI